MVPIWHHTGTVSGLLDYLNLFNEIAPNRHSFRTSTLFGNSQRTARQHLQNLTILRISTGTIDCLDFLTFRSRDVQVAPQNGLFSKVHPDPTAHFEQSLLFFFSRHGTWLISVLNLGSTSPNAIFEKSSKKSLHWERWPSFKVNCPGFPLVHSTTYKLLPMLAFWVACEAQAFVQQKLPKQGSPETQEEHLALINLNASGLADRCAQWTAGPDHANTISIILFGKRIYILTYLWYCMICLCKWSQTWSQVTDTLRHDSCHALMQSLYKVSSFRWLAASCSSTWTRMRAPLLLMQWDLCNHYSCFQRFLDILRVFWNSSSCHSVFFIAIKTGVMLDKQHLVHWNILWGVLFFREEVVHKFDLAKSRKKVSTAKHRVSQSGLLAKLHKDELLNKSWLILEEGLLTSLHGSYICPETLQRPAKHA